MSARYESSLPYNESLRSQSDGMVMKQRAYRLGFQTVAHDTAVAMAVAMASVGGLK